MSYPQNGDRIVTIGFVTSLHRMYLTSVYAGASLAASMQCESVLSPRGYGYCRKEGSPYSITERMVPEVIPVLGSQPAGDVSHKPGGRLPLLSARPAVTPATLKRAATNFAAW